MDEAMAYLEERREKDPAFSYEVIIVNDGSRDGTSDVALKYVRRYGVNKVRLLEFVKNRGKGGAVRMVSDVLANSVLGRRVAMCGCSLGLSECSWREDIIFGR